ncbi:hypothetical protein AGMMS50229_12560 [Campylobacterota bacterium]|nr:hypothetical protein AGMMS50229_12560 [Campylobacterota bacterium]
MTSRAYRCIGVAFSGGEYKGTKIAYIDPSDMMITATRSVELNNMGRKTLATASHTQLKPVDGLHYCGVVGAEPYMGESLITITATVKNTTPLFSEKILVYPLFYVTQYVGNHDMDRTETNDGASRESRAAAYQVIGITGMPTLAEVEAERARLAQVAEEAAKQAALEKEEREKAWLAGAPERERLAKEAEIERQKQAKIAEQERIKAEKAKADAEAKRKAAEAQARAAERARVAKQSENYQVGYGYARSGGWETAGNNCETYAQNMSIAGKGKYAATKDECVQGASDGKAVLFKEIGLGNW